MNARPCVDDAALEKLMELGGKEFVIEMIDLFLDYVPQKLAEAQAAEQAGDLVNVQRAVHPIKSSSGNVGAFTMRDLAGEIELLARDQRGESIAAMLAELETICEQVKTRLQEHRETLEA